MPARWNGASRSSRNSHASTTPNTGIRWTNSPATLAPTSSTPRFQKMYASTDEKSATDTSAPRFVAVSCMCRPQRQLAQEQRQHREVADAGQHEQERQQVQARRPPAQADRVDRPHRHRQDDEQVALVQAERRQRREAAAGEDRQHAGERHADAGELQRRQPLAQEHPRQRDDHHRDERVQDHAVGRGRVVEAEVGQRVVRADADRAEEQPACASGAARSASRAAGAATRTAPGSAARRTSAGTSSPSAGCRRRGRARRSSCTDQNSGVSVSSR